MRKQSAHTEELLLTASNHDWCPQIRVQRARVSPALHQKRRHSKMAFLSREVKWSEVKLSSELHIGSSL